LHGQVQIVVSLELLLPSQARLCCTGLTVWCGVQENNQSAAFVAEAQPDDEIDDLLQACCPVWDARDFEEPKAEARSPRLSGEDSSFGGDVPGLPDEADMEEIWGCQW
jgi:hypothetical protein